MWDIFKGVIINIISAIAIWFWVEKAKPKISYYKLNGQNKNIDFFLTSKQLADIFGVSKRELMKKNMKMNIGKIKPINGSFFPKYIQIFTKEDIEKLAAEFGKEVDFSFLD